MSIVDWLTLTVAMLVGGYVLGVRHVRLCHHGVGSVLMHLGVAAVCAAAATAAMHTRSSCWLGAVIGCALWLIDSHGRWRNARPRAVRQRIAKEHAGRHGVRF